MPAVVTIPVAAVVDPEDSILELMIISHTFHNITYIQQQQSPRTTSLEDSSLMSSSQIVKDR
jgi:hypothetical protein